MSFDRTRSLSRPTCSAFTRVTARTLALPPIRGTLTRRLQTFRHLHACSGCFRLERLPGGACTHWKAPPLHGADKEESFASGGFPEGCRPMGMRPSRARPSSMRNSTAVLHHNTNVVQALGCLEFARRPGLWQDTMLPLVSSHMPHAGVRPRRFGGRRTADGGACHGFRAAERLRRPSQPSAAHHGRGDR